jgi:hypothetical protein
LLAATAVLAIATPASAQRWEHAKTPGTDFQARIDAGIRNGDISTREAMPLRNDLRRLASMERSFRSNGLTRLENARLQARRASLSDRIDIAEHNGVGSRRPDRSDLQDRRDGDDRFASNPRFDRPNRGDRFAGDVGIGDSYSARMGAVPARYRDEFRDGDEYYYRYDDNRIYQVDRVTGTILRLLDLPAEK